MTDKTAKELTAKFQQHIPALLEKHRVPGLSLTLIHGGEIFGSSVFGVQSSISQEPVTDDTVFEAASLSKPVFAYAALKLCESGILDLDTPLANAMPEPHIPGEPRLDLLTMRHVLCHTSGFPNWRPEGEALKIHFPPGRQFSYSGEGYMYLQAVVTHITGQDPAAYMAANLLKPFGMANSRFVWDGQAKLPVAVGHDEKGEAKEKSLWEDMCAAASLHCTAEDFGRFMCAVMRPSAGNPAHLSPEMTKEMLTVQVQVNDCPPWSKGWPDSTIKTNDRVSWGLGWGLQRTSKGNSIWHWGDNGNYRAFAVGFLEEGDGIAIMTNGKNGQSVIDHVLRNIVGGDYPGLDWLYG